MALPEATRSIVLQIAWKCYGLPYIWGGDDAVAGFDCSGFVIEILKSVGILTLSGDWTADDLFRKFAHCKVESPHPGCLVFWKGHGDSIRHVELCISSELSMGASGGGSRTKTRQDAIAQNAWIKIRPIEGRGVVAGYVDPFLTVR